MAQIIAGQTYYTGNTTNPDACTVVALLDFDALPAHAQVHFRTLQRTGSGQAKGVFVAYTSKRKWDHHINNTVHHLWLDVAEACWYPTLDALYQRDSGQWNGGLLRCTLPGER